MESKMSAIGQVTLEIFDPSGAVETTHLHAPRLDTLAGKTICELSNGSWWGDRTFPVIRELLQKQFPDVTIIPYTGFPEGVPRIETEGIGDIIAKRGCQAVIVGNAG